MMKTFMKALVLALVGGLACSQCVQADTGYLLWHSGQTLADPVTAGVATTFTIAEYAAPAPTISITARGVAFDVVITDLQNRPVAAAANRTAATFLLPSPITGAYKVTVKPHAGALVSVGASW